jgi:hypothetical protein
VLDAEEALQQAQDAARRSLQQARSETDAAAGTADDARDAAQRLRVAFDAVTRGRPPADTGTRADDAIQALRAAHARVDAARAELHGAFPAAREKVTRAAQDQARDPRFREALIWQNRRAVATGLDKFLQANPAAMRAPDRKHEMFIASYLHRYCLKNDTIGFFGPVGWARWDAAQDQAVRLEPGAQLLDRRGVYFELWPIDALAERLASDPRLRPWAAPRRFGFVRVEGSRAKSPLNGEHELTKALELVLRACDGETPACELAARLTGSDPDALPDEAAVFGALETLVAKHLVTWTFELGVPWKPERALRAKLDAVADPELRAEAQTPLARLESARDAVAAAAGRPAELERALDELGRVFTEITGAAATRRAGEMYAGRSIVFEDCRRAGKVSLGRPILEDLGPALSLVLDSARWLTCEIARGYDAAFREVYAKLSAAQRTARVPFADFWFRVQRLLLGTTGRPFDVAGAEARRRWQEILAYEGDPRRVQFESATLRSRAASAFAAPASGWSAGRQHSPDLMLCAASADAIGRGEYLAVLGEIHAMINSMDISAAIEQHPASDELVAAQTADHPEPFVAIRDAEGDSTRAVPWLTRGQLVSLSAGLESPMAPPERTLALADLVIHDEAGTLVVSTLDGRWKLTAMELFGPRVGELARDELEFGSDGPHAPRIAIDRLVIRRESWRVPASELLFAETSNDEDAMLGANRWARALGLPKAVFVRSPRELKPVCVRFDSPVSVRIFAKMVRQLREQDGGDQTLSVTEMLPGPDELWLRDAEGDAYTCELRLVAVDRRR